MREAGAGLRAGGLDDPAVVGVIDRRRGRVGLPLQCVSLLGEFAQALPLGGEGALSRCNRVFGIRHVCLQLGG